MTILNCRWLTTTKKIPTWSGLLWWMAACPPRLPIWATKRTQNTSSPKNVVVSWLWACSLNNGPVHKGANHVPKAFLDHDSDPFLIWKPNFALCERKALLNQAIETRKNGHFGLWSAKKAWLGLVNAKLFGNHDLCVSILEVRAEAMHGSISAVGTKYYLAVRKSCSWSGQRLQCLWTHVHVVQIRKRIMIWNGFRNVIRSFVNRPSVSRTKSGLQSQWLELLTLPTSHKSLQLFTSIKYGEFRYN